MSAIDAVTERLTPSAYGIAAASLLAVVVLMNLRIASRNLDLELASLQVYAQAIGVWMVFVVAGAVGVEGRHIEIDYFSQRLPARLEPCHEAAVSLLNFVTCVLLVVGSIRAAEQFWGATSPSANIPLPVYYVPVVAGLAMLGLVYLGTVVDAVGGILGTRGAPRDGSVTRDGQADRDSRDGGDGTEVRDGRESQEDPEGRENRKDRENREDQ